MRILVIGGTRFTGLHTVRRLADVGHEITVFHRGDHSGALPPSVDEIRDQAAAIPVWQIPDRLRALEPEIVLHMIAMGEEDTRAAMDAFSGIARRIVVPSSGDVYRAFGIFTGIEKGPVFPGPLHEEALLRTVRYPYRRSDTAPDALAHYYDKILVEEVACSRPELPATILRLPKVYGPEDNADLATVYGLCDHPHWRWTHGHVENVAAAIVLAITDDRAGGRTYNVGETQTPTMGERLAYLPDRPEAPPPGKDLNFDQDIVYDTSRIRDELGYREVVDEREAMIATVTAISG